MKLSSYQGFLGKPVVRSLNNFVLLPHCLRLATWRMVSNADTRAMLEDICVPHARLGLHRCCTSIQQTTAQGARSRQTRLRHQLAPSRRPAPRVGSCTQAVMQQLQHAGAWCACWYMSANQRLPTTSSAASRASKMLPQLHIASVAFPLLFLTVLPSLGAQCWASVARTRSPRRPSGPSWGCPSRCWWTRATKCARRMA